MSTGSTFGQMLRKSRLASFDATLPQVYTTKGGFKHRRDWGLMRNLPELKTDYITVQALDTPEHQTPFQSANDKVQFVRRWHEMGVPSSVRSADEPFYTSVMGSSRKSTANTSTAPNPFISESTFEPVSRAKNIAEMRPLQFERFKKSLLRKEKRDKWFDAIIAGKVRLEDDAGLKEDLEIFLKITTEPYRLGSANGGLSYLPDLDKRESMAPLATVRGRILSVGQSNTFALGGMIIRDAKIGGSGAAVTKAKDVQNDEEGTLFNVSQAYLDEGGRPHLILQVANEAASQATLQLSSRTAKMIFDDLRMTPKDSTSRSESTAQRKPVQNTAQLGELLERLLSSSKRPNGQKRQIPKIHQDILDITKESIRKTRAKSEQDKTLPTDSERKPDTDTEK